MSKLSHKALERAFGVLLAAGILILVSLVLPPSIRPPKNPPPGSVSLLVSPRDTGVYRQGALSEKTSESFLGLADAPLLRESLLDRDGSTPSRLVLKLRREGFHEMTLELETQNQVLAFLSKPIWPHEGALRLEPGSLGAQVEVWMKERRLPLAGLTLIAVLGFFLIQAKARAARRADLLEKCKANAGQDPYLGTTLKEFLIVELLGRGSFGMVYRAIPESRAGDKNADDYAVAIKVSTNLDPKAVQRFYQELDIARQVEHPNIVRIFDKGLTANDSPFLVMELLRGMSLTHFTIQDNDAGESKYLALEPVQVAQLLEPVVVGLQHAHDKGVVHRDLNPNNIMVLEEGQTKILDFGLSKLLANKGLTMTQDGGAGTLKYLPYEQIVGFGKVDARADQFSLGCMMYHMLSGCHPFGDEPFEVLSKVSQRQPARPLSDAAPGLAAETAAVVDRMLSHDPDHRYETVRDAFAAFKASLSR